MTAIVVTGAPMPVAAVEAGQSISVLDAATIAMRQQPFVLDLLRSVPGVAVARSGGSGQLAQVRIRGAEGNHTLVLIDGVEVAPAGQGEFDFAGLLTGSIAAVEVLRGPQGGLYGANAMGGVIDIRTTGGDAPPFAASIEGGSFASLAAGAAARIGGADRFLAASAHYRRSDGISAAAIGTEADGDSNVTLYLRGASPLGSVARLAASLRMVSRDAATDGFDFSGGPLQGLPVDDASFARNDELSAGLTLSLVPGRAWDASLSASYSAARSGGGMAGVTSFGDAASRLKLAARAGRALPGSAALRHALTVFADWEEEAYRNRYPFDPTQRPTQRRDMAGIGAHYRLALHEMLFLGASIRHDANSDFADATSWSAALSLLPGLPGTRLHASYGTGATNPTFFEQFGFNPGTFVGNPALRPETARSFDIGIEQRLGPLRLDLTWFTGTLTDEIADRFPSVVNDPGRSRREGVEVALDGRLGALDLAASYSWLDARDPDGTPEVRRPRHQASLDAGFALGSARQGRIALGLVFNGTRFDTDFRRFFVDFAPRKTRLDDYLLLRAAASWQVAPRLQAFARAENLLDEAYEETLGYGTAGLSGHAGLRLVL